MPKLLGSWELIEPIAHSDRTLLYRARPAGARGDSTADYVVKMAQPASAGMAMRFLAREALAGRTLSHAHVVSILGVHLRTSPAWLVMPYLPGCDLARLLRARSSLPVGQSVWIARQVAEALTAMHAGGWLHGDVKPANIMVGPEGHVTLIDLGFARRLGTPECAANTPLLGTPAFAPPERLHGTGPATEAADIYSLGTTMRTMLGRGPIDAATVPGVAGCASDLDRLLQAMLAPAPDRRPSAVDVRDRLTGIELDLLTCSVGGSAA